MIDVLFLGTGASVPSREKALPGVAVRCSGSITLFDCGEGTQRQFMFSKMSFMKIDRIFISHVHGDHTLGLSGLLQTMGLSGRKKPLSVFGPKGIEKKVYDMISATDGEVPYPLEFRELKDGEIYDFENVSVEVFATEHNIESYGFVYREKDLPGSVDAEKAKKLGIKNEELALLKNGETVRGVKPSDVVGNRKKGLSVVYTGDTKPCESLVKASQKCDVMIHECTYAESESELAEQWCHSTAKGAAEDAKKCRARALFLIHLSNRYKNPKTVLDEAREIFSESYVPSDLDFYSVTEKEIRPVSANRPK